MLAAIALIALGVGCAGTTAPVPDDRSQLLAAGFKVVPATTRQQQEHLQSLPPGQVTAWQRTGKMFFVYPDAPRNQLYVGTQKEYEAFRRLVPSKSSPLSEQAASDLAAYNKQDEAMRKATGRDSADPYAFWDRFDNLGWQ
jgi:hypothetical protein